MRKVLGSLIKGFACFCLTVLISACIAFSNLPGFLGISLEPYEYIGFGVIGVLLSLLLYAYGHTLQSLADMAQRQTASRKEMEAIAALLREHPPLQSFVHPTYPIPIFEGTSTASSLAAQRTSHASDWRRPAPEGETTAKAPEPAAAIEPASGRPRPVFQEEPAMAGFGSPLTSAPALEGSDCPPGPVHLAEEVFFSKPDTAALAQDVPLPEAKPDPLPDFAAPAPKVACSLCKTVQASGQMFCVHCGAMFINDLSA